MACIRPMDVPGFAPDGGDWPLRCPVRANKTVNLFTVIRPTGGDMPFARTGVHLWYKKNNNRNNDKCILME